ncbi:hypothetical protein [Streptomyces sp. NPDC005485]|uniref:hypothetical protein n=1 Tax=Streptomyces sp. NPDC005485 TaxID=3155591 RepID=UPI0033AC4CD2
MTGVLLIRVPYRASRSADESNQEGRLTTPCAASITGNRTWLYWASPVGDIDLSGRSACRSSQLEAGSRSYPAVAVIFS